MNKTYFAFLNFLNSGGKYQMLLFLEKKEKLQFNQFKVIENPKREGKLSPKTISESLKLMEEENLIEKEIILKNKRNVICYKLSDKGKEYLDFIKEAEVNFNKIQK